MTKEMLELKLSVEISSSKSGNEKLKCILSHVDAYTEASNGAKLHVSRRSSEIIDDRLIQMLGSNALGNDFKVDKDMARICKAVRYLVIQLGFIAKYGDEEALSSADDVLKSTVDILSKNGG